ncbi:MAG: tetratricopeptide repeat protein [Thainema sp.]
MDATNAIAYYNLANQYAQICDRTSALTAYTQAIQLNPNLAEAYCNRGILYFQLGQLDAALHDYAEAIRLRPHYSEAYYNRSVALARQWRYAQAAEDLQAAIRLVQAKGEDKNKDKDKDENKDKDKDETGEIASLSLEYPIVCHYRLGLMYAFQAQFNPAIEQYQQVLQHQPDHLQAQYQLKVAQRGYHFTSDWFSPNIAHLQPLIQQLPRTSAWAFLEIGAWEGRATCWFLDNMLTQPEDSITCIDPFLGSTEHQTFPADILTTVEQRFDQNIARSASPATVTKLKAKSEHALRELPWESYNLIYVDGEHQTHQVLEDAVLSWRLLKSGGLLVFDDYDFVFSDANHLNPKLGIDAFLQSFHGQYQILHQSHQLIVQKL